MFALGLALLLCVLLGSFVDRGLLGAPGRGILERFGRALALGLGSVGTLSMAADSLGLGVSLSSVCGLSFGAMALLAWPCIQRGCFSAPQEEQRTPGLLKILGMALLVFAGILLALDIYTGWLRPAYQMDALVRWMFKTKALFVEGTLRGPISTDPAFSFTHQRYPPLVSHVANVPCLFSGSFNDRIASAIFTWYAVALVGIVFSTLKRSKGWFVGALGAAWVAGLPILAIRSDSPPISIPPGSGAFSAMADIPLALFLTGAAAAAMDGVTHKRPRAFLEAALMLGFAALTKNEGLPLVAGAFVALVVCTPEKRWRKAAVVALSGLAIYYLVWGRLAMGFPALDENYPGRINVEAVSEGLHRLPLILGRFGLEFTHLNNWNVTWYAVAALLILSGPLAWDRGGRVLLILFFVQMASYVFAFTITAWTSPTVEQVSGDVDPVRWLLDLTTGRLFLHVAPLMIVAALRAAPLSRKNSPGEIF